MKRSKPEEIADAEVNAELAALKKKAQQARDKIRKVMKQVEEAEKSLEDAKAAAAVKKTARAQQLAANIQKAQAWKPSRRPAVWGKITVDVMCYDSSTKKVLVEWYDVADGSFHQQQVSVSAILPTFSEEELNVKRRWKPATPAQVMCPNSKLPFIINDNVDVYTPTMLVTVDLLEKVGATKCKVQWCSDDGVHYVGEVPAEQVSIPADFVDEFATMKCPNKMIFLTNVPSILVAGRMMTVDSEHVRVKVSAETFRDEQDLSNGCHKFKFVEWENHSGYVPLSALTYC